MKKVLVSILAAAMAISLAACGNGGTGGTASTPNPPNTSGASGSQQPDSSGSGKTIRIGIAAPLTGSSAAYGELMVDGAKLAIEEINAAGGVNGQMLELVPLDDKNDPSEAALVAQRFCDDETITAVIAHGGSTNTLAGAPIYEAAKMPFIGPSSNNPTLTELGYEYFVRLGLRDDRCGNQVVAMLVNNLGIKKIGVIYANNDYGVGNLEAAAAAATTLGAEVVASETYNPGLEKDYSTIINKLQKGGCEGVVIYADHADAGLYFQQAHALGFDVPHVGQSALTYSQMVDLAGADALQNLSICVTFNPYSERETVSKFMDSFLAIRPGEVPSEPCAGSYDIVKIVAQAMSEGATRENLSQWIKNTTDSKDYVFTMEEGCTLRANMTWDEKGDTEPFGCSVLRVAEDGKFVNTGISVDLTGLDLGI